MAMRGKGDNGHQGAMHGKDTTTQVRSHQDIEGADHFPPLVMHALQGNAGPRGAHKNILSKRYTTLPRSDTI